MPGRGFSGAVGYGQGFGSLTASGADLRVSELMFYPSRNETVLTLKGLPADVDATYFDTIFLPGREARATFAHFQKLGIDASWRWSGDVLGLRGASGGQLRIAREIRTPGL